MALRTIRTMVPMLVFAAALAATLLVAPPSAVTAHADETPLGVGGNECNAASDTFVDEKLGIYDAAAAEQPLASTSAQRGEDAQADDAQAEEEASQAETDADSAAEAPASQEPAPADTSVAAVDQQATYADSESGSEPEPDADTDSGSSDASDSGSTSDSGASEEDDSGDDFEATWYTGAASAYDPDCNGGTSTSSGIPLDWSTPTVASTWLPLGSYVEICYDGVSVVAQVTDRGPFVGGRDLDLSPGVFNSLGFDSTGAWGVRTVSYRPL